MTATSRTAGQRAQAVVLAAIMVLSVVAMSAAFAGSVAASNHVTIDRPADPTVEPGDTFEYTVEISSDQEDITLFDEVLNGDAINAVDAESDASQALLDDGNVTVVYLQDVDSDTINITAEVDENAAPGDYSLTGTVAVSSNGGQEFSGSNTVTVESPSDADHHVTIDDQSYVGSTDSVEVASANSTQDYVVVIHNESGDIIGNSADQSAGAEFSGQVDVDEFGDSQEVTAMLHETDATSDYGAPIEDDNGDIVQDTAQVTIAEEPDEEQEFTRNSIGGADIWQGQSVSVSGFSAGETVQLREGVPGDSDRVRFLQANGQGVVNFATDDLDENPHFLRDESGSDTGTFWVNVQDVSFAFADDEVPVNEDGVATVDLNFDEDNRNELVDVEISGEYDGDALDDEELEDIFADASSSGDESVVVDSVMVGDGIEATFEDLGEYDFTVDITDTTASDDASVEIVEAEEIDPDVEFGDIDSAAEGDIVEIPLEFNDADEYDDDDVNIWINESAYSAELTLDLSNFDGDQATLTWNTYYAGSAAVGAEDGDVFSIEQDNASAIVQSETDINRGDGFRLNPAGYTLGLFDDAGAFENRIDSGSVTVTERNTGDASVSIAPGDKDYEDDIDLIRDNATDSAEVAQGDLVIVEQEVSGVFGYLDSGDADISVSFTNTESPAYSNPETFDPSASHVDVYEADDEEAIYYVISTEDRELSPGDMEEWSYNFSVGEDNPYVSDEQTASNTYSIVPRTASLDLVEEPYQVTPSENATFEGTTTMAPGSTVEIVVDRPGHFLDQGEVEVELENGERVWSFTHDYSDRSVGEEFDIYVGAQGLQQTQTDGIFDDVHESETMTDAQEMRDTLDELQNALNVDSDDELTPAIEDLQSEISSLQAEIDQLETQLSDVQSERDQLQDQYDGAQEEIADLESQISDLESQVEDLSSQNEDLQSTNDELSSENEDLQSTVDEVNSIMDDNDIEDLDGLRDALDNGSPGFGPIAALIAILAGGAVAVRRRLE